MQSRTDSPETSSRKSAPADASKAILDEDLRLGEHHVEERIFQNAAQVFHSAAWTAARAGLPKERFDAQWKLADALLHARQFQAALANYRHAQHLAEQAFPDTAEYWMVRASIAQALRRNHSYQAARNECDTIRERLESGLIGDSGRHAMVHRIIRHVEAQLEAGEGNFAAAVRLAVELAREFESGEDRLRSGLQYFNAALWGVHAAEMASAAEAAGVYARAVANLARARLLVSSGSISDHDEKMREVELLSVLVKLVGVKLVDRGLDATGVGAAELLLRAQSELEQIGRQYADDTPAMRIQELILRLRIAERRGDEQRIHECRSEIRLLARRNRPDVAEWLQQDLAVRFNWKHAVKPLNRPDQALSELVEVSPEPRSREQCARRM